MAGSFPGDSGAYLSRAVPERYRRRLTRTLKSSLTPKPEGGDRAAVPKPSPPSSSESRHVPPTTTTGQSGRRAPFSTAPFYGSDSGSVSAFLHRQEEEASVSVASLVSIPGENERQRAEQERKMEQMRREEMWERKERRQKEQSEEEERRLWMMRQAENKRRAQIMDTFNRVQMEDNAMRDKISMSARRPESHSPEGAPSVIGAASHTRNSNTVSLVSKPASDRDCRFREQMARVYAEREEGLKANEPGPSEILRTVSPFSRSSTPRDNMIREQMAWIYGKDEGVLNVPVQCELPSAEPLETLQLPAVRLASHIEMPTFDTPAEGSGPTAGDLGNTVQPRQSIPELDTGQMRVDLRVEEISLELGTGQIKVELHAEETVVQETDGIKVELAANEILHELHKISHELDSEEVKVELYAGPVPQERHSDNIVLNIAELPSDTIKAKKPVTVEQDTSKLPSNEIKETPVTVEQDTSKSPSDEIKEKTSDTIQQDTSKLPSNEIKETPVTVEQNTSKSPSDEIKEKTSDTIQQDTSKLPSDKATIQRDFSQIFELHANHITRNPHDKAVFTATIFRQIQEPVELHSDHIPRHFIKNKVVPASLIPGRHNNRRESKALQAFDIDSLETMQETKPVPPQPVELHSDYIPRHLIRNEVVPASLIPGRHNNHRQESANVWIQGISHMVQDLTPWQDRTQFKPTANGFQGPITTPAYPSERRHTVQIESSTTSRTGLGVISKYSRRTFSVDSVISPVTVATPNTPSANRGTLQPVMGRQTPRINPSSHAIKGPIFKKPEELEMVKIAQSPKPQDKDGVPTPLPIYTARPPPPPPALLVPLPIYTARSPPSPPALPLPEPENITHLRPTPPSYPPLPPKPEQYRNLNIRTTELTKAIHSIPPQNDKSTQSEPPRPGHTSSINIAFQTPQKAITEEYFISKPLVSVGYEPGTKPKRMDTANEGPTPLAALPAITELEVESGTVWEPSLPAAYEKPSWRSSSAPPVPNGSSSLMSSWAQAAPRSNSTAPRKTVPARS